MKSKYVEERFPLWFSQCVLQEDVSDYNDFAFAITKSREDSNSITTRHNEVVEFLAKMADAWDKSDPEAFKQFWQCNI